MNDPATRTAEPGDHAEGQQEASRALLQQVRSMAGWRVAPRHVECAVQALSEVEQDTTVENVTRVVNHFQGERSQRQRRNADLWRLLGAQLAVRGKPGDPAAQQAFIGRAKARCDRSYADSDFLLVATALASGNHPLTPEVTADVVTWMVQQTGRGLEPDAIDERLDQAVEAAMAARAERTSRR